MRVRAALRAPVDGRSRYGHDGCRLDHLATEVTHMADREDVLRRLEVGIAELTASESWIRYLTFSRRFHNYSASNVMLIMLARPDATRVAGFHTWRSVHRNVRKGASGIPILCPVRPRTTVCDEETREEHIVNGRPVNFRVGYVFAYEDTDGEAVPEIPCRRLAGDDVLNRYDRLLGVAQSLRYSVIQETLPGERNGDCHFASRRIRVDVALAPAMKVKVLSHELGHALLHDPATGFTGGRELAELEAESVAYVAGDGLGLDTSSYSLAYVAHWAGGGDAAIRGIAASANRINRAARQILDALDDSEAPAPQG